MNSYMIIRTGWKPYSENQNLYNLLHFETDSTLLHLWDRDFSADINWSFKVFEKKSWKEVDNSWWSWAVMKITWRKWKATFFTDKGDAAGFCTQYKISISSTKSLQTDEGYSRAHLCYMQPQEAEGSQKGNFQAGNMTRFRRGQHKAREESEPSKVYEKHSCFLFGDCKEALCCVHAWRQDELRGCMALHWIERTFVLWMGSCFCRKPWLQQSPCKAPLLINAKPEPLVPHMHTLADAFF